MPFVYTEHRATPTLSNRVVMAAALLFVLAHGLFLYVWVNELQVAGHALMGIVEPGALLSSTAGLLFLCGVSFLAHPANDPLSQRQRLMLTGMRWLAWLSFSLVAFFAALGGFCVLSSRDWSAGLQWSAFGVFLLIVYLVFCIHPPLERLNIDARSH